jgi:hypothetical protein
MLESLIGPDIMKKIMAKSAALISVILAWIGLIMLMMTVFISVKILNDAGETTGTRLVIFHAMFWPMFAAFACAGAALVVGGMKTKVNLGYITFIASLWVMMNAIMGWVQPPVVPSENVAGMGDLVAPMMLPIQAVGGFMGVLGGLVGIGGAGKYLR